MVTATVLASCTKEQEDFFSDSSANRADAAIAADVQVLTSATNGWVMQYFPESQQTYGGYNIIARFTADGKVEAMSEFSEGQSSSSLYKVTQSAGMVLSFDTYNLALHVFSDPAAPLGGSQGKGLEGDYDFSILKATAEEIILKGKNSGNKVVMTPMTTNDWVAYLENIAVVESAMKAKKYTLTIAGKELLAMTSDRTLVIDYEENGEEKETVASYIITPEGMKFYEPVEILGQKFSSFKYVEGAGEFTAADNSGVKLAIIYPTLAEIVTESWWCLAYSGMGDLGKQYWDVLGQVQEQLLGEVLYYAIFGLYDGNFGITFNSGGYWGSLLFNYAIAADDELILQFRGGNNNDNGAWYVANAYYADYFVPPFGTNTEPRKFKLTADDPLDPSWVLMTDVDDPTNTIMLYASVIQGTLSN